MTRAASVTSSSLFFLSATVQDYLNGIINKEKRTADRVRSSFYVDDFLTKADSEAFLFSYECNDIMTPAGMQLRKWTSNCEKLQEIFNRVETTLTAATGEEPVLQPIPVQPLVGTVRGIGDTLRLCMKSFQSNLNTLATNRNILQATAKLFNPVGLICPF